MIAMEYKTPQSITLRRSRRRVSPTEHEKKYLDHIGEWKERVEPITRPERLSLLENYYNYAQAREKWGMIQKVDVINHCLYLSLKIKAEIRDSEIAKAKRLEKK